MPATKKAETKADEKQAPEEQAAKLDRPDWDENDFEIEQLDGARAVLRLGKEERLVDQADLHRVQKAVAKGIQGTY